MWIFILGLVLCAVGVGFLIKSWETDYGLYILIGVIGAGIGIIVLWFGPSGHSRAYFRLDNNTTYRVLTTAKSGDTTYAVLEETDETNKPVMFFSLEKNQQELIIGHCYTAHKNWLVPLVLDTNTVSR